MEDEELEMFRLAMEYRLYYCQLSYVTFEAGKSVCTIQRDREDHAGKESNPAAP